MGWKDRAEKTSESDWKSRAVSEAEPGYGELFKQSFSDKPIQVKDSILQSPIKNAAANAGSLLPILGATAGGIMGGTGGTLLTPGAGTIGGGLLGAGVGAGLGESVKQGIGKYLGVRDDSPLESAKGILAEGGKGVLGEMGGQAASKGISKAFELAPKIAEGTADVFGKLHLSPNAKMSKQIGKEGIKDAVRESLDSGAIKLGQTAENTAANLENLRSEVGAVKGDIVRNSDAQIDPTKIVNDINSLIDKYRGVSANKPIVEALERKKADFLEQYLPNTTETGKAAPLSASQVEAEKTALQDAINWPAESGGSKKALKQYSSVFKNATEEAIPTEEFMRSKEAYGNLANAQKMADKASNGGGVAQALINMHPNIAAKIVGKRVTSTLAVTANEVAKALKSGQVLEQYFNKDTLNRLIAQDIAHKLGGSPPDEKKYSLLPGEN